MAPVPQQTLPTKYRWWQHNLRKERQGVSATRSKMCAGQIAQTLLHGSLRHPTLQVRV